MKKFIVLLFLSIFTISMNAGLGSSIEKEDTKKELSNAIYLHTVAKGMFKQKRYEHSLKLYQEIIDRYQSSGKEFTFYVALAHIEKANIFRAIDKFDKAIVLFENFINNYNPYRYNIDIQNLIVFAYSVIIDIYQKEKKNTLAVKKSYELIDWLKDNKITKVKDTEIKFTILYGIGYIQSYDYKFQDSINTYQSLIDELIKREDRDENQNSLLANSIVNMFECQMFLNIDIESRVKEYQSQIETKEFKMYTDMLLIISKSVKSNQDEEMKIWEKNFGDREIEHWSFDLIDIWNKKMDNQKRIRVKKYIDKFKTYLPKKNIKEGLIE